MKTNFFAPIRKSWLGLLGVVLFLFSTAGFSQQVASKKRNKAVEHFYTSFDGTRIYYDKQGQGELVLLIHGFTGTSDGWKKSPAYSLLLQNGFQVIAVDLRDNGRADKPQEAQAYEQNAEVNDGVD